LTRCNLFWS